MAPFSPFNAGDTNALLERAAQGDRQVLGALLDRDRSRLRRMVALRLDRRLQGRIDPSDVIQEAQLEASDRLDEYLRNPTMPFFLWLRLITGQRLLALHRRHLGAKRRTVTREWSLNRGPLPQATSAALAAQLLGRLTTPSEAAIRAEIKDRLHLALEQMDPIDREVLTLRHFEQLTTSETALELGINEEATKKRHIRALKRLKVILAGASDSSQEDSR
jgi:RNA polymerase sigma-70 factor (ECF subfamily)